MKKIILSTVACATMVFAASDYKYEITPMYSTAFPEHNTDLPKAYANAGLALGMNTKVGIFDQIELGFLRSTKDVNYKDVGNQSTTVTRVFTNLIKEFPFDNGLTLYALAGAGYETFGNERAHNHNSLFGNYGVGLKMPLFSNIKMKFDLRHAIETDHGDNTLLYNLGIAIPFGAKAKPAVVKEEKKPEPMPIVMPKDSDKDGILDSKDQCPNSAANAIVNEKGCDVRDDDKDGVINKLDQCPNTIAGAKVDAKGCLTLVNLDINFETNSSKVDSSYTSKIVDFANMMKSNNKLTATINAYTDSRGSNKFNQKLSENRAKSVVNELVKLNVEESRLKAVGHGENDPIMSNMTSEGRAANRRVTATINK